MSNQYIHLTNSSINRHNDNLVQQRSIRERGEVSGGSKFSLNYLQKRLREMGIDWARVVVGVCLKTSFELFGFDVRIDTDLRPSLIEVNSSPRPSRENALDYEIKNRMVQDTLLLASPPAFDRDLLSELLKKRLGERPKSRWNLDKDLPGCLPAHPYLALLARASPESQHGNTCRTMAAQCRDSRIANLTRTVCTHLRLPLSRPSDPPLPLHPRRGAGKIRELLSEAPRPYGQDPPHMGNYQRYV